MLRREKEIKKESEPKKKAERSDKANLNLPMRAVVDNIVFSKTNMMAFYRIPTNVYDFLSTDAKIAFANSLTNGFAAVVNDRNEPVEGMIITANTPVDLDSWEDQVRSFSKNWNVAPGFEKFIERTRMMLEEEYYMRRNVYVGFDLGRRNSFDMKGLNFFEMGIKSSIDSIKSWIDHAMKIPDDEVSAEEQAEAQRREKRLFQVVSTGNLRAERCTAEELLLYAKRQFYPLMPAPYLDVSHGRRLGPGDIVEECYSSIRNKFRWLEITQQLGDQTIKGYRATMTFTRFPKYIAFPNGAPPFLYFVSQQLGLPFTTYAHFLLTPHDKMKKKVEKARAEKKDELKNASVGETDVDSATNSEVSISDGLADLNELDTVLNSDKTPWMEGYYHIIVEAQEEQQLKELCAFIKQSYSDIEVNVLWNSGNQAELLLDSIPGATIKNKTFGIVTTLNMLATSGFNFANTVGDPLIGDYSHKILKD